MLRRYSSKNLDTILLKTRRTTIGSADTCDVVVKGKGISPIHASIESNSSGFWLREHSLSGCTTVNERPVFGQVEIHSGDLIQVGSSSPPFVFDSEWSFGTRPSSSAKPASPQQRQDSPMILPVIGKKIIQTVKTPQNRSIPSANSSASSTESNRYRNNSRSIGNNLLQRVVKLQAEVIAKDEKIRQLSSTNPLASIPHHIFYQTPIPPPPQPLPALAHNHGTAALSRANPAHRPLPDQKTFELFAYRAFIGAITSQLRQFNDRVLRTPQRDSAELFTAMCRAVDVPLSSRISDVEKYCEAVLIDNDFEDGDELMHRLDNFIRESRREKILELTNELEVIMPLIRDAAANARENIKVCNVFTQWSRQFGDLLRKSSFSAATLFQAIDDLKNQFAESHMSRHWLPPSITPILRLAALELEKRDGVVTPSTSPLVPATVLDRKKSIDMTLDSCISQVEAIVHEIDYHVIRLCNKARDYSSFQSLDLDSVTRISKVVDSMKSSIDQLAEHSFKEEPTRPNSVLFVEITNEDITKTMKKSDSEGSQGSLRKVSVAPKISDPLSENDEILAEQRRIEEQMKDVIDRIGKSMGEETHFEKSNEGSITVDFGILKTLINQSENLLLNFEFCRPKENNPDPPMIVVDSEEEKEEEEKSVKKLMENVKSSKENDPHSETPIPTRDSPDMTSPDDSEAFGSQKSPKTSISHQEEGEEEEKNKDEEDNAQEDRGSTNSEANNDLINDQSEQQTVVSPTNENPQGQSSPNSLQDQKGQEEPTSLESTDATSPLPSENTIQKEQTSLESSPQNKSPEENVPELQMVRHSQSADKMTSHLRSHINTANGKPHVTYQYPIRKYYSPPMKRRSKSEDRKIKETLTSRPRFVLY